ncbi:hypothetical protein CBR_g89516 [Chara braunii]|uniref:Uncharacterized protein n=1 Tax=Chara braunii TaxID=69332 RepID=A0A388JKS5_CHABU|nr:hypothetical protein CBR_g89516 [Chara braunii]|eukprot:GBG45776.1 hypothetical protein CBR_g89516 [Chara braunii]
MATWQWPTAGFCGYPSRAILNAPLRAAVGLVTAGVQRDGTLVRDTRARGRHQEPLHLTEANGGERRRTEANGGERRRTEANVVAALNSGLGLE